MKINGKEYPWKKGLTAEKLLKELEYSYSGIILSVNNLVIPKENYGAVELNEGDLVKVIHPIVGG